MKATTTVEQLFHRKTAFERDQEQLAKLNANVRPRQQRALTTTNQAAWLRKYHRGVPKLASDAYSLIAEVWAEMDARQIRQSRNRTSKAQLLELLRLGVPVDHIPSRMLGSSRLIDRIKTHMKGL